MTLKVTILGCGSSGGVPRPALGWGVCDPANPKNRRRRTSLLVERRNANGVTRILVDTSPDLREQLLAADVDWLNAVLYTHEHADHTHGIDDLRALFLRQRHRIDVYLDERTAQTMHARFGYCFAAPPGSEYPPIVTEHRLRGRATRHGPRGGWRRSPFCRSSRSTGIFRRSASASAGSAIPATSAACRTPAWRPWRAPRSGSSTRYATSRTRAISASIRRWPGSSSIKPRRAILTNLHSDLDYETLRARLPEHVEPAFDGLSVTMPDDDET